MNAFDTNIFFRLPGLAYYAAAYAKQSNYSTKVEYFQVKFSSSLYLNKIHEEKTDVDVPFWVGLASRF